MSLLTTEERKTLRADIAEILKPVFAELRAALRLNIEYAKSNGELSGQNKALQARVQELEEEMRWRDAETEPPEDCARVLVQCRGLSEWSYIGYRKWGRWYQYGTSTAISVEKWMPCPVVEKMPTPR